MRPLDYGENLLTELADHRLDLVLPDQPEPGGSGLEGYSHMLGS